MRFLYLIFSFLIFSFSLEAQTVIRGVVADENSGETLIGATVMEKGTTKGTITDWDGSFELKTDSPLPITLTISYLGYASKDHVVMDNPRDVKINMSEGGVLIDVVEVEGKRISEKQKAAPLTVESLDILAIKETPADNFYDGLGALKGVDVTGASLGFKIINTRGFNSTSPVRSLQIIDGVDNQAPGLNFSLGNFLGSSELDVMKVDIIVGASSAFYGPNAFNGVISMETKNPFFPQGMAASVKVGERNMMEGAFRYSNAIRNRDSLEFLAVKINFSYLRADDWEADNYNPVFDTESGLGNPGGWDQVNSYGDEYFPANDATTTPPWNDPGLGIWHREGYDEIDLVDYDTRNIKSGIAFHLRTKPALEFESPELILASSFGNGTTVYQGDNRFSLKNILFFQNRLEYRKKGKYFIRAYATNEDAGDSYDPYFTALRLLEASKPDDLWSTDYRAFWKNNYEQKAFALGYPRLIFDPVTFESSFDRDAAEQWLIDYQDTLTAWHSNARDFANRENLISGQENTDFYEVGTQRFEDEFNRITSSKSNEEEKGTRFYSRSALYHMHGEYTFTPTFVDKWVVGGNGRMYRPDSDGTIFYDTANVVITNTEFGAYTGVDKSFYDGKINASATLRVDKNQNFNLVATPAASLVFKPKPNNYLRVSFSSAVRNPTLSDQYLFLDVGRATLVGNLNGADSLVTVQSFSDFRTTLNSDTLVYFDIDPIQPERVKTFEIGYRTTLFNAVYMDAGYYYSIYDDFLGYNIGLELELDPSSNLPESVEAFRYSANSKNRVTTQGFSIGLNYYFAKYYMVAGNYSWNRLNKILEDDPIIPAFNTPEHKFNLSISGRDIKFKLGSLNFKNIGFNINYKWIQGFLFEGSPQFTGEIPTYDLLDGQINYKLPKKNLTFKLGASNILNKLNYQTYGGPRIGRLAYFSIVYDWQE